MFPSSGYFSSLTCPFYKSGLCERPHCHFRHVAESTARRPVEPAVVPAPTADEPSTAAAGEGAVDRDLLQQLVSQAVRQALQGGSALAVDTEALVGNIVSSENALALPGATDAAPRKHRVFNVPTDISYFPTPLRELKRRGSDSTARFSDEEDERVQQEAETSRTKPETSQTKAAKPSSATGTSKRRSSVDQQSQEFDLLEQIMAEGKRPVEMTSRQKKRLMARRAAFQKQCSTLAAAATETYDPANTDGSVETKDMAGSDYQPTPVLPATVAAAIPQTATEANTNCSSPAVTDAASAEVSSQQDGPTDARSGIAISSSSSMGDIVDKEAVESTKTSVSISSSLTNGTVEEKDTPIRTETVSKTSMNAAKSSVASSFVGEAGITPSDTKTTYSTHFQSRQLSSFLPCSKPPTRVSNEARKLPESMSLFHSKSLSALGSQSSGGSAFDKLLREPQQLDQSAAESAPQPSYADVLNVPRLAVSTVLPTAETVAQYTAAKQASNTNAVVEQATPTSAEDAVKAANNVVQPKSVQDKTSEKNGLGVADGIKACDKESEVGKSPRLSSHKSHHKHHKSHRSDSKSSSKHRHKSSSSHSPHRSNNSDKEQTKSHRRKSSRSSSEGNLGKSHSSGSKCKESTDDIIERKSSPSKDSIDPAKRSESRHRHRHHSHKKSKHHDRHRKRSVDETEEKRTSGGKKHSSNRKEHRSKRKRSEEGLPHSKKDSPREQEEPLATTDVSHLPDLSALDDLPDSLTDPPDDAEHLPMPYSDSDDDDDQDRILAECERLFNEYQLPTSQQSTETALAKARELQEQAASALAAAVAGPDPACSSSRHRVAHSGSEAVWRNNVRRAPKLTPAQSLHARWLKLAEMQQRRIAELEEQRRLHSETTSASAASSSAPPAVPTCRPPPLSSRVAAMKPPSSMRDDFPEHTAAVSRYDAHGDPAVTSVDFAPLVESDFGIAERRRVAHVPNVDALLKKPDVEAAVVTGCPTPPAVATTAQSVSKGTRRVAHLPSPVSVSRPRIPSDSGNKVPVAVRQKYLNLFCDELLKLYPDNPAEAFKRALEEEQTSYSSCTSRRGYPHAVVSAVKRLRDQRPSDPTHDGGVVANRTVSHMDILAGKGAVRGSWSIEKSKRTLEINSVSELHTLLQKHVMTSEQLDENSYPRPDPTRPGRALLRRIDPRTRITRADATRRDCVRCNRAYSVDERGVQVLPEQCCYHWGRLYSRRGEKRYSCCSIEAPAEGCCVADAHVSDNFDPDNMTGYQETFSKPDCCDSDTAVYALDCEMSYTTGGCELTRLTVTDMAGQIVFETFVKPANQIVDYNTRFSGITAEDMDKTTMTISEVQAVLLNMFSDKTILMGHSLESDFKALKLIHKTVVDTSVVFPHKLGPPYKRALRNLVSDHLRKIIQNDVGGHDSAEDARSCMELMLWKLKEDAKVLR